MLFELDAVFVLVPSDYPQTVVVEIGILGAEEQKSTISCC